MVKRAGKNKPGAVLPLRLRKWRDSRGWSQAELAALLGVSDATINRIEQGKQNWTPDFLMKAVGLFGCSIYDMLPADPNSVIDAYQRLDEAGKLATRALIEALDREKNRA